MDTTESLSNLNSFPIDPQTESIDGSDARISELRQRLMQFGKVLSDLEEIERTMQHKQQMQAQHALSQQMIALRQSIKSEQRKLTKIRQTAEDFLNSECKQLFIPKTMDLYKMLSAKHIASQLDELNSYELEMSAIEQGIKSNPSQILRLFFILFSINDSLSNNLRNQERMKSMRQSLVSRIVQILPSIKV